MNKLFPDDGKVSVDTWYKEKMERLRQKWNPPILLKKIWEEIDKSGSEAKRNLEKSIKK